MFNGDSTPQVAKSWYKQIEQLLKTINVQVDQDRVALATIQFEGEANNWWEMIQGTRRVENITWVQFKDLFYEKYFLGPVKMQMAQEFVNLTQGRMMVTQYANWFEMLSRYAPEVVEDESAKARRFEWGLDPVLRKALVIVQLPTYTQVVDRALSLEKEMEETRRQSG